MITRLSPQPTSVQPQSTEQEIQPQLLQPEPHHVLTEELLCEGMSPLGTVAIDIMCFLENGRYDTSNSEGELAEDSPPADDALLLPPHAPGSRPSSSTLTSSATGPSGERGVENYKGYDKRVEGYHSRVAQGIYQGFERRFYTNYQEGFSQSRC